VIDRQCQPGALFKLCVQIEQREKVRTPFLNRTL